MRSYLGEDVDHVTLNAEKEALYRELYAPHLATVPGFDLLIAKAAAAGVKLVVGTAAPNENIVFTLDGLDLRASSTPSSAPAMSRAASRTRTCSWPAPKKCGVLPANCIVFEDAPLGVEAARRAGMRAVVLTTTLPASAFAEFDNVIRIAADFSELDLDALFASTPAMATPI